MSLLDSMSADYMVEEQDGPCASDAIMKLQQFSLIDVPSDLVHLLSEADGIQMYVRDKENYFAIWSVDECIEMNEIYFIQDYLPNSLAFGGDGGGGTYLYLDGNEGFGIYYLRFEDLDMDEAIMISKSLTDLLIYDRGLDALLSLYEV